MFCQIFTKKMAMVMLLSLAILTVAAIACAQGQGDKFPIIAYGGPHPHLADYFPQIMDCNFNVVFNWYQNIAENDFIAADEENLYLITSIYRQATWAQTSEYESDLNNNNPHFYHSWVGREVEDDSAGNGLAWVAQASVDTAGWMQHRLRPEYRWEQEVPTYRLPKTDSLEYYAHFRMRLAPDAVPPSGPIAKIDAILKDFYRAPDSTWLADTTLMKEDSLWYSDFDTAGALGQYAHFTISFFRHEEGDSGAMDYRIYWYGNTDLWADRVTLEDKRYRKLMAGDYDEAIRSRVNQYSGYSSLFRWYLEDEPTDDMFKSNAYVREFLEDSVTTASGVQAIGYDELLPYYLDVVSPNELTYDRYPIKVDTDTATDVPSHSLQGYLDTFLVYTKEAKETAEDTEKPFWYCAQAYEVFKYENGRWEKVGRYSTNNELKCNVWLSLCCGAQGLFYFLYASSLGDTSDNYDPAYPPQECQIAFAPREDYWLGGLVKQKIEGAETTWVKVETDPFRHDTLWNAVRDMNAVVGLLRGSALGFNLGR